MEIIKHTTHNSTVAELQSDELLITCSQDGLDIMGELYYEGFDKIIIHSSNITEEFFDLKNGMAGEILQKFSNYRIKLAIVGDFSRYTKKSIRDFIRESNTTGHINFVGTVEEALALKY
ncbi:MAG: DUF4180 domain-containing protein [Bacteroidales bacterium]